MMQPAYIQRFVRLFVAMGMLLLVSAVLKPQTVGLGESMWALTALVGRYVLYSVPIALLLGIPAGLRPGSLLDRLLQLPVVLLAGIPAVFTGLMLLLAVGQGGTHPAWLPELGATLVVAPWLARAVRMGLAAAHGRGLRRTALACLGRLLQQYGNVAVCALPLETLLRAKPIADLGGASTGTAVLGLVLPALLSHFVGDLLLTTAAADGHDATAERPATWWAGLGTILALGVLAPAVAVWSNPSRMDLKALLAGPAASHWLGTDMLGRDLLSVLGASSRASLALALGAAAVAVAGGTLLGLLGTALGKWGQVLAPELESPSLLAPFVAGICVAVWVKPGGWAMAVALGAAMVPWIAPAVRRLAGSTRARRPACLRAVAGRTVTVVARTLYLEMFLGWMALSVPSPAWSLGSLLTHSAGPAFTAPHVLIALGLGVAGVTGLNLVGSALGAEE